MFGLLFLNWNVRGANAFADNLFPGQAPFARWRRLDLTSFDVSYAAFGIVGIVAGIWCLKSWRRKRNTRFGRESVAEGTEPCESIQSTAQMSSQGDGANRPSARSCLVATLLFWSVASFIGLSRFYLYYPAVASRYLLDFSPALMAWVFLTFVVVPKRLGKIAQMTVAAWLLFEIAAAKVPLAKSAFANIPEVQPELHAIAGTALRDFGGTYTPSDHPFKTGIRGNGGGWESDTGFASDIVTLVVDRPEFIQLEVSDRRAVNGEPARNDAYLAQLDGSLLKLREVRRDEDKLKITFDVPESIRVRNANEVLFICFSSGYDAEDRASERFLYSVRWHGQYADRDDAGALRGGAVNLTDR